MFKQVKWIINYLVMLLKPTLFNVGLVTLTLSTLVTRSVSLASARRSSTTTNARRAAHQRGRVPESTQPQTHQVLHLNSLTHSCYQKSCSSLMFLSVLLSRPPPPTQHYENTNPGYAYVDQYSPRPPSRPEAAYKGSHSTNKISCFQF